MNTLIKTTLAAAIAFTGFSAQAAVDLPDFTVQPDLGTEGSLIGATSPFNADRINGSYVETITFTSATTFETSLRWTASVFRSDDDTQDVGPATTGLAIDYGLYALFQSSGTWFTDGTGDHFNFSPGGVFNFYYDNANDTEFSNPVNGLVNHNTVNDGDDELLITGSLFGAPLSAGNQAPGGGQNEGSFGTVGPISLTAIGETFFTAPDPFYNIALTSGDFTRFTPAVGATIHNITGKLSVDFQPVAEPELLSLLGISLLGLGFTRRKKAS